MLMKKSEIQQKLASFEFYKVFPSFGLIQIEITVNPDYTYEG